VCLDKWNDPVAILMNDLLQNPSNNT